MHCLVSNNHTLKHGQSKQFISISPPFCSSEFYDAKLESTPSLFGVEVIKYSIFPGNHSCFCSFSASFWDRCVFITCTQCCVNDQINETCYLWLLPLCFFLTSWNALFVLIPASCFTVWFYQSRSSHAVLYCLVYPPTPHPPKVKYKCYQYQRSKQCCL